MSLLVMLALGLAGSLHCVQMCGPLVLSFGIAMTGSSRSTQAAAHIAYHAGRILTYAALGAVAGWMGSAMSLVGSIAGIENTAALVAGVFMIAAGFLIFGATRGGGLVQIRPASRLNRAAGKLLRIVSLRGKFATGLLMGLLPCGLIYGALMRSLAVAAPLPGALNMAAFGLGTSLPLLGLGIFSASVSRWVGLRGQNWAAAGIMLMGIAIVWRGLVTHGSHMHHMH